MSCTHRCNQGRSCTCAITTFYAETEGVMPMATGCSLKALPDPAKQPLPVIHKPRSSTRPTLAWFAVLAVSAVLAALCTVQAARFFN